MFRTARNGYEGTTTCCPVTGLSEDVRAGEVPMHCVRARVPRQGQTGFELRETTVKVKANIAQ